MNLRRGECERQGQDGDDNAVAIFTFKGLYIRETLSINSDGKAGTLTLQRPEVSFSNLKRELPEAGRVNADSLNLIDNSINSFRGWLLMMEVMKDFIQQLG